MRSPLLLLLSVVGMEVRIGQEAKLCLPDLSIERELILGHGLLTSSFAFLPEDSDWSSHHGLTFGCLPFLPQLTFRRV